MQRVSTRPAGLFTDLFRARHAGKFAQIRDVPPLVTAVGTDPHVQGEGVTQPSDVAPGLLPRHFLICSTISLHCSHGRSCVYRQSYRGKLVPPKLALPT